MRLLTMARIMRMVFSVCFSETAAICTHGMLTGWPMTPPRREGSKALNRTGARNSMMAMVAAKGDLPEPLASRRWASE